LESISFTNNHPKEVEIEKSYGGTLFYSFQPDDYEDTPNPDAIIKQFKKRLAKKIRKYLYTIMERN